MRGDHATPARLMTRPATLLGWIVHASLRFRFIVVALAVTMMVVGALQIPNMRVDAFPEFAPPRVEIQTACLGLSTADVETLVTVPLEQALNGIKNLDEMRSKSVPQLSSIELIFQRGTNLLEARQLVQERLANVQNSLPTWAAPPVMLPPVSATARVMQVGMTSRTHSLIAMSMMAYWTIRARLLRVDGVANVAIWGERLQMLTVQVDPHAMQARNVTLNAVMEATSDSVDSGLLKFSNASVTGTGGFIESGNSRLGIRSVLPIITPADLARTSVAAQDGQPVRMDQVAEVKEDHQPLIGDAVVGGGPGLLLVIEKLPWGNTLAITRGVEEALQTLQPGLPDITFDTRIFQQANFIDVAIHNLTQALLLGFLLVIVILALFLFEWRVALISWISVPLSLLAATLVLYWHGETLNTMTLAGLVIALGAVVDDAVIGVENILRRLRQSRLEGSDRSAAAVILDATLEVRSPIVYATLIIVAAAVPVFLLEGLTGAFFRPLAVSYTLALAASMLVALTLTPALCLIMLGGVAVERQHSPITRWLQDRYTGLLRRIIQRPRGVYAGFIALTVVASLIAPHLGQSLFPTFREHYFLIHWITPPGTSAEEEQRIVIRLSGELRTIPGVRSFGSHIGQAFLGEEVAGVNFGENWIGVDPDADLDRTVAAVRNVIDGYPGLYADIQTYLNERIEEVLTGAKEPIVVRIYGQDLDVLRAKAAEVQARLGEIDGIEDNHVDLQVDIPQIKVEVDLARAGQYGLKPGDVRRAASTLVAGEEVGDIFRDGKTYDVVVWSTPATRANVAAISDLPIDTPSGSPVRLGDVAKISIQPVPNLIERDRGSRRIDVVANVRGRDLGSVFKDVSAAVKGVQFPRGYHAELLGEYKERQAAQQRLFGIAVIAALAILLLLQTAFNSLRLAILSFFTLPMALVGGVLAAFLTGGVISLGSLLGFFTVFGIAARNGILLVNHAQHLEEVEGESFGPALVLRAARERLSPILMTSLATGLGIVPLIVLGDRPGHEIEYPLAVVILGGLVTGTLLNLFAVPSLYLRFGRPRRSAA
jgi:CzcA family heavy metal efflux pump